MNFWRVRVLLIMVAISLMLTAPLAAEVTTKVKIGEQAPDFALPDQNGKLVKLSDFRGNKNVVLAFYVLAFTAG